MRWSVWALAAGAATALLFACVGSSPTLPMSQCDGTDTFCNGACTNTQGDPRNCGACGKTCNTMAGEVCQKGACGPACTGGTSRCGMGCIDVQHDPNNCGDCNKVCGAGESCVMGACTLLCSMGLTSCPASAPPAPMDGGITDGSAPEGGGGMDAGPPAKNVCSNLQTDPLNCGKCGNVCPPDKNGCDNGVCKIYTFTGIVQNLNQMDLHSSWQECFSEPYGTSGTTLTSVLTTKCGTGANLMLGCRTAATKTLLVAAEAPRADVTFDVGVAQQGHHIANGTAWYYGTNYSWGFFVPLDGVNRNSCDTGAGAFPDKRMCWHTSTGALQGGYRCGTTFNNATERVILQAP